MEQGSTDESCVHTCTCISRIVGAESGYVLYEDISKESYDAEKATPNHSNG